MEPVDSKKAVASKCHNESDPSVRFATASKRAAYDKCLDPIEERNANRNPQIRSKFAIQFDPSVRFQTASKRAAHDKWLESIQEPSECRNPQNSVCSDTDIPLLNPSPGFCTQCPLPHAPYCAYDGSPHHFCVHCRHFSLDKNHPCRYIAALHRQQEEAAQLRKRLRSPTPSPSPAPPDSSQTIRVFCNPNTSECHFEEKNAFAHLEKD